MTSPTRKPAGRASRFLATGGAIGTSLVLVGVMAGAATQNAATAPTQLHEVVVVPAEPAPTQIVVMLPETGSTPIVATLGSADVAIPSAPKAPVKVKPAAKAAPVTKSSGS